MTDERKFFVEIDWFLATEWNFPFFNFPYLCALAWRCMYIVAGRGARMCDEMRQSRDQRQQKRKAEQRQERGWGKERRGAKAQRS